MQTLSTGSLWDIALSFKIGIFKSYEGSIIDYSEVLVNERYSAAQQYKDNPYIYVSIIEPIYATDPSYGDTASLIWNDYFAWDDQEDWEEYIKWKNRV